MIRIALILFLTLAGFARAQFGLALTTNGLVAVSTNFHGTQIVFSASTPLIVGTNRVATVADLIAGTVTGNQWRGDTDRIGLVATNALTGSVLRVGGLYEASSWTFQGALGESLAIGSDAVVVGVPSAALLLTAGAATLSPGVYVGDGSGLTGLNGASVTNLTASSVTLGTNQLLRVDTHPTAWARSSDVATNGAVALAMEQFATTAAMYRASVRCSGSLTNQSAVFFARSFGLSAVATNHGTVSVVYDAGAGATNLVEFLPRGGTNVLLSWSLTTSGVYSASGTNLAGNRSIDVRCTATVTGQGGTNYGRAWLPAVWSAEQ